METDEQVQRSNDLEASLLSRFREWVDLLPWLRLLRVLRVAGSPPLLMLTAVMMGIGILGQQLIIGVGHTSQVSSDVGINARWMTEHLRWFVPASVFAPHFAGWWYPLTVAWTMVVWTPMAMLLARQGALLTAGRSMMPLREGFQHAAVRSPSGWLTALVPLLCILPLAASLGFLGWAAKWLVNFQPGQVIAGVIAALVALPCGMLAFGSLIAIPISWAALVNERQSDPLDALSRGYEYLFRRPIHLAIYTALSLVLLTIVGGLATAVAIAATEIVIAVLNYVGAPAEMRQVSQNVLASFPNVVALSLLWSLIGGVYLLLRWDAGGQEVEEIWEPTVAHRVPLPELPRTTLGEASM